MLSLSTTRTDDDRAIEIGLCEFDVCILRIGAVMLILVFWSGCVWHL